VGKEASSAIPREARGRARALTEEEDDGERDIQKGVSIQKERK
jgi:hypothetical protein